MTSKIHKLILTNCKNRQINREIKLINSSGFFDAEWYKVNNPDVVSGKINPAYHFLIYGGLEGRDPSKLFSSSWYLDNNDDVRNKLINPLVHYLKFGIKEGRIPKPIQVENETTPSFHTEDSTSFNTIVSRPKYSGQLVKRPLINKNMDQIAIVIQGPIDHNNKFTLETIKSYQILFTNTLIILSTWEDEDVSEIEKTISPENFTILLNKKPNIFGNKNINLQIVSSISGVNYAKKLGKEYVLKCRTDQRIYSENALNICMNFIRLFPLKKEIKRQKMRLIVPNIGTLKYRPYGIGDMIMFGQINDMVSYWDAKLDDREFIDFSGIFSVKSYALLRLCETYLCSEFLLKLEHKLQWTIADSWLVYSNHFCIIDQNLFDIYWDKYDRQVENKYDYYDKIHTYQIMKFGEWMDLYFNQLSLENTPEWILDYGEGTFVKLK